MYKVYELHTYKLVKEFKTEQDAKDYKKYIWDCKRNGETMNGVYYVEE